MIIQAFLNCKQLIRFRIAGQPVLRVLHFPFLINLLNVPTLYMILQINLSLPALLTFSLDFSKLGIFLSILNEQLLIILYNLSFLLFFLILVYQRFTNFLNHLFLNFLSLVAGNPFIFFLRFLYFFFFYKTIIYLL